MKSKKEEVVEKTIASIKENLSKYGKCIAVRPTGFGKTFISLSVGSSMYKNVVFLYPRNVLIDQIYREYKENISKVEFKSLSYRNIIKLDEEGLLNREMFGSLDNPETLFILDEVHMACATKTLKSCKKLMSVCSNAHFLGLTATPERADKINPEIELFDMHKIFSYTLADAISDGLFTKPDYVLGTFGLSDNLCEYKKVLKLQSNNMSDNVVKELTSTILELGELETKPVLDKYLHKLVEDQDYMKILIFFPMKKILNDKMSEYEKIFQDLFPGYNINVLKIYTGEYNRNTNMLPELKKRPKTIDLIASIDKLTLGYHIDDITGIIMNRPTNSNIIYKQQIGRCINIVSKIKPIIFDFVGNYSKKQYSSAVTSEEERKNAREFAESTFGIGNITLYDELANTSKIKRIMINNEKEDWILAIVQAYLYQDAPIEYCTKKLEMSTDVFLETVENCRNLVNSMIM